MWGCPMHKKELGASHDVQDLIMEHNIEKALLDEQIFQSTLKAKICFPEVFEVSPER